jgi:hypothetical protein
VCFTLEDFLLGCGVISEADGIHGSVVGFMLLELEGESLMELNGKEFLSKRSSKGIVESCIGIGKGKTESLGDIGYVSAKGNIFSWNTTSLETNTVLRCKSKSL